MIEEDGLVTIPVEHRDIVEIGQCHFAVGAVAKCVRRLLYGLRVFHEEIDLERLFLDHTPHRFAVTLTKLFDKFFASINLHFELACKATKFSDFADDFLSSVVSVRTVLLRELGGGGANFAGPPETCAEPLKVSMLLRSVQKLVQTAYNEMLDKAEHLNHIVAVTEEEMRKSVNQFGSLATGQGG